jgi:hypothetical protein
LASWASTTDPVCRSNSIHPAPWLVWIFCLGSIILDFLAVITADGAQSRDNLQTTYTSTPPATSITNFSHPGSQLYDLVVPGRPSSPFAISIKERGRPGLYVARAKSHAKNIHAGTLLVLLSVLRYTCTCTCTCTTTSYSYFPAARLSWSWRSFERMVRGAVGHVHDCTGQFRTV